MTPTVWVLLIMFGFGSSGRAIDASQQFRSRDMCERAVAAISRGEGAPRWGDRWAVCIERDIPEGTP